MSININPNNPYVNSSYPARGAEEWNALQTSADTRLEYDINSKCSNYDVFEAPPKYDFAEERAKMSLPSTEKEFVVSAELQEKLDNSFLMNVQENRIGEYYALLLNCTNSEANRVFNLWNSGTSFSYAAGYYGSTETALARYGELRDEIYKVFGEDEELLNLHLETLDKSLEGKLCGVARGVAERLEFEQFKANLKIPPQYEPHKLAIRKDFDKEKFEANGANLMKELAQSFIAKIREGLTYADARKSAIEYMLSAFSKTTSVNNLSFSDYMLAEKSTYSETRGAGTKEAQFAIKNELHKSFNNSTEMSEELRALLG